MTLFQKLTQLRAKHWRELRVEWNFYQDGDVIMFHSFGNRSTIKGNGAAALKEVCDAADHYDTVLKLCTYYPKLYSYYEGFGFQTTDTGEYRYYFRQPAEQLMEVA